MTAGQTIKRIAADLLASGLRPGGVAMVHSSLSALGHVPGAGETVIRGLLDALGPRGTLLMPALSYKYVNEKNPVFDCRRTPSNVGAIPEHFRKRRGTVRSVHPTHSACGLGPRAAELLKDHHLDTTPVGPRSPFGRLPDCDGQVVMLGCGLLPNTSIHGIEELVEPEYLFGGTTDFRLVHADGSETIMHCRRHDFAGWVQRYDRIASLLEGGGMRTGNVLAATVHVLQAPIMWQRGLAAIRKDPLFFVDRQQH